MKNRRGAEKRRCQRYKTLDDPGELCDCRCRWYSVHIGIPSFASYRDAVGTWPTLGFSSFASYRNAVIHLGSALGSILLQVGGVVVVLASEDAVAAAAAYRVEVPVLGFVDLLAEASVDGVLAAGAAIAAPTAGSTSAEVEERLPGPGAASGGWWSKRPAARGKGF